ncbi:MAG: hypothetical protein QM763_24825 [Agriterribacter sp.]
MKRLFLISVAIIISFSVTAQSYNPTTIYTRKLTALQGEILTSTDYTPSQKAAIKAQTLSQHPNATFLADATQTYNSHGYAWHLTEGNTNVVWINQYDRSANPNVYKYWTDGSFVQVCNQSDADKIHYYNGDHSAVYSVVVSGKYESKWGMDIRIRHDPTDVPSIYNAQYRKYYASTVILGATSTLCTGTRTFSVKNIPRATYSWTKSSGLTVVGSSNSYQYSVQRNGSSNGAAWVEVQVSTPCSEGSATSRINFTVGIPQANNIAIWNSASSTTTGNPVGFVAGYPPDNRCQLVSTNWQVSMSANIVPGNYDCGGLPDNGTSKNIFSKQQVPPMCRQKCKTPVDGAIGVQQCLFR